MQFIKSFVLIYMLTLSLHASVTTSWLHDFDEALVLAQKEHKDIYVFIGADTCRFCDRFKERTLSDAALMKDLKQRFILVYLSRDRHMIPDIFETKGVPKHYFLTPEGRVYYYTWGGRDISGFYLELDQAELSRDEELK